MRDMWLLEIKIWLSFVYSLPTKLCNYSWIATEFNPKNIGISLCLFDIQCIYASKLCSTTSHASLSSWLERAWYCRKIRSLAGFLSLICWFFPRGRKHRKYIWVLESPIFATSSRIAIKMLWGYSPRVENTHKLQPRSMWRRWLKLPAERGIPGR